MTSVTFGGIHETKRPLLRHGYWHLVPTLSGQALRTRFRQSSLHLVWAVIQPAALVAIFAFFFHGVLKIEGQSYAYLSFILCGFVLWRFIAAGLSSTASINDSIGMISKSYFPREIVPIVNVVNGWVDLGIGVFLMLGIAWVQGYPPSVHLVAMPLIFVLLLLVTLWMTILFSAVAVFIRDLRHGMPLLIQALFFATPIMYPASQLPRSLHWMINTNPVSVLTTCLRDVVLSERWPTWWLLIAHIALSAAMLVLALLYVRSVEHRMVDVA